MTIQIRDREPGTGPVYMDTKVKFIGKVFVAIPLSLFYTSLYLSGSR